jgi:hypothetical protein
MRRLQQLPQLLEGLVMPRPVLTAAGAASVSDSAMAGGTPRAAEGHA